MIWSLSVHDKAAGDDRFIATFDLFRVAATDARTFVRKGVDMALRAVGKRNRALNGAASDLARELAAHPDKTARWIGSHTLREITGEKVQQRLKA